MSSISTIWLLPEPSLTPPVRSPPPPAELCSPVVAAATAATAVTLVPAAKEEVAVAAAVTSSSSACRPCANSRRAASFGTVYVCVWREGGIELDCNVHASKVRDYIAIGGALFDSGKTTRTFSANTEATRE